ELFVPIRVRASPAEKQDNCPGEEKAFAAKSAATIASSKEETGEVPLAHCLQQAGWILIRGEPGSGKTTSLRHLARSYARGTQQEEGYPAHRLTPLFVRLADFARARKKDPQLDLVRFVVVRAAVGKWPAVAVDLESALQNEIRDGGCLILLDGLDEVGQRREVLDY